MSKFAFCIYFILFLPQAGKSQMPNFIPNASFEKIKGTPEKWFYTGADFNKVFEEWTSPTAASPDVYHEQIYVPTYWKENGFDQIPAFRGKSKVGITLYGCNQGKLHCREYISVPLLDSLVIGQEYYFSMWVAPMTRGMRLNKIQVAFDKKPIQIIDDRLLELKPYYDLPINSTKEWQRAEVRFFAETEATHLTIGNFRNDHQSEASKIGLDSKSPYAYYYIDEITLFKIPPILPREVIQMYDSLILKTQTITLENVYFDHNETKLLPASFIELNKLLLFLEKYRTVKIKITGHTDHIGSYEYNQKLSKNRAIAVMNFLTRHNIDQARILYEWKGYDQPIATNATAEGRQLNRRVTFKVID